MNINTKTSSLLVLTSTLVCLTTLACGEAWEPQEPTSDTKANEWQKPDESTTPNVTTPPKKEEPKGGGLTKKDNPKIPTTITGRVVNAEGAPVLGAGVYLLNDEGEAVEIARTDMDGSFSATDTFAGERSVVVHDGRGQGVIKDLKVFAGGKNKAGTLELGSLEKIDKIVDIFGIGFEERISRGAGSYQYAVYNNDATMAYAFRQKNAEEDWTLVSLDTATGVETVLGENIRLSTRRLDGGLKVMRIFGDRYLFYSHLNQKGSRSEVVYDTKQGTIIFDSLDFGVFTFVYGSNQVVSGDTLYMSFRYDTQRIKDNDEGLDYKTSKEKLFSLDMPSGKISTLSDELVPEEMSSLTLHKGSKDAVFYSSFLDGISVTPRHRLWRYDLASNKRKVIGYGRHYKLDWNEQGDVFVGAVETGGFLEPFAYRVTHYDTKNGTTQDLPVSTENLIALAVNTQGTKAAFIYAADGLPSEIQEIDLKTLNLRKAPLKITHKGQSQSFCLVDYYGKSCTVSYNDKGQIHVAGVFKPTTERWAMAVVEDAFNPSSHQYAYDIESSSKNFASISAFNAIERHEDVAGNISVQTRNLSTGFLHQYSVEKGQVRQRTFLNAEHVDPAFSKDGKWLYYFTTDPISGYVQLFRISSKNWYPQAP